MSDVGPVDNRVLPTAAEQSGAAARAFEFGALTGKLSPFELICAGALAVAMVSFITGVVWALVT
jgi:hypothetical protein